MPDFLLQENVVFKNSVHFFKKFGDCQNTGLSYAKVPYLGNMEGNIVSVEEKTDSCLKSC